jgi:hypothetical protein
LYQILCIGSDASTGVAGNYQQKIYARSRAACSNHIQRGFGLGCDGDTCGWWGGVGRTWINASVGSWDDLRWLGNVRSSHSVEVVKVAEIRSRFTYNSDRSVGSSRAVRDIVDGFKIGGGYEMVSVDSDFR